MADTSRSSFIPKQTSGAVPSAVRRKKKFHVFGFLASALLIASVFVAGGAWFYKGYTEKELQDEKVALKNEQGRFDTTDLREVRTFERRLQAAEFLLDHHLSFSKFFDALEFNTKSQIQFLSLLLEQSPSQNVTLEVTGGTEEFASVALQAMQLDSDPIFEESIFTEFETSEGLSTDVSSDSGAELNTHRVNFTLTGNISPALLAFEGSNASFSNEPDAIQEGNRNNTSLNTGSTTEEGLGEESNGSE